MSARGAHCVGLMRWGTWGSGGGRGQAGGGRGIGVHKTALPCAQGSRSWLGGLKQVATVALAE
jgi:hypothetical protein